MPIINGRRVSNDSHEYDLQQYIAAQQALGNPYTTDAIGDNYTHTIGTNMAFDPSLVGDPSLYRETRGMTPQQFAQSGFSPWQLQPNGTMTYTGRPSRMPTWIDQGGAGNSGIGYALQRIAPYAAATLGVGAALGGLSGLGIPGLTGSAPAVGEGISPSLASAGGGVTDFSMASAANAGDLAALGSPYDALMSQFNPMADYGEYLSGVYGTPSSVAPGVAEATGFQWPANSVGGLLRMPIPTPAPFAPPGSPQDPGTTTDPDWTKIPMGGLGALSGAAQTAAAIKSLTGIDVNPNTLGTVGNLLSTGLGAYASQQQANSLEKIANQARSDRQPFLDSAVDMLQNPDKFYQRPEVMGAIDASLRGLSAKVGNPINNPGALAQQAAYNTGLYNNTLNSRAALGLGNQDVISKLQTNAAIANTGPLRQIGSGLGSLFGQNYGDVLGNLGSMILY